MTRTEAILLQDELHPGMMLPEICLELRMSLTGGSSDWSEDATARTFKMLECRVATWIPSASLVDNAVFMLIGATFVEVARLLSQRCGAV